MLSVRTIYPVQAILALFTGAFWGSVAALVGGSGGLIWTVGGVAALAAYGSLLIVTGRVCPPERDREESRRSAGTTGASGETRGGSEPRFTPFSVNAGTTRSWRTAGSRG